MISTPLLILASTISGSRSASGRSFLQWATSRTFLLGSLTRLSKLASAVAVHLADVGCSRILPYANARGLYVMLGLVYHVSFRVTKADVPLEDRSARSTRKSERRATERSQHNQHPVLDRCEPSSRRRYRRSRHLVHPKFTLQLHVLVPCHLQRAGHLY